MPKEMGNIQKDLKPPLKWAGGKRWLVPYITKLWEKHSDCRFVEPLCGGLAVPIGLMPERALLNDVNPHLINFYTWLKKGLISDLQMSNERDLYYEYRRRFNDLLRAGKENSKDSAMLFYYLNRTGYNGLCRFNKKGEFNVPFGRYKTINYKPDFTEYISAFANWEFRCGDFEEIELEGDEFIYADPPYDVEFRQYSQDGFVWEDQVRLAEWLKNHKGPVAVSNQATERILELYKSLGFEYKILNAPG